LGGDGNRDAIGIDGTLPFLLAVIVMPRTARVAPGGFVYHVLNRSVGRMHMFRKESDFEAFERIMVEVHLRQPIRILSYCVLSNHWHFVAWPEEDGQLTDFFRRLTHIHAIRWRVSHRTVGYGHLYQGRFQSFPVQGDDQLLGQLLYAERNPLSAGLVDRAQLWRWGSLWSRTRGTAAIKALLSPWPLQRPANWTARVNAPLTTKELDRVRVNIEKGRPYGEEKWVRETVKDLRLEQSDRPDGRPGKASPSATEATS
jgi:putative transposase